MFAALMKQSFVFSFIILILLSISAIFGPGCANIVPPQGGPRDSLPPRLVKASPADSTTNFRGNRIELTFDEFIDLQNVPQNLLFTPTFETNPVIDVRLRTMTIRLRDSLEANTTYSFNFGNALKDVNEGNVLPGFTYTFSTGPTFDTLSLRGNVVLSESGKIDTTLIVVLHRNLQDSAVVKERPRYITRLDRNGNFSFHNLPSGTFALYALGDAAGRRYNNRQYFAFTDSPIVIRPAAAPITLYAYKEITAPTASTPASPAAGNRRNGAPEDKRLRYTTNLSSNQQDLLNPFVLTFEQGLRFLDTTKVRFVQDSTFSPVAHTLALDSTKRLLTVQTAWKEGTPYHLIVDKDFAEDSLGRRLLKSDTISLTTRKSADYGRIRIRLRNADVSQNPVLQLLQNGTVVYAASIKGGQLSVPLFSTGDYDIQVLYDRNNNGKWDAGQFFGTRRQPEIVKPIERKLTVKAGQEADFEISL
jgi:hypothetical protein